MEVILILLAIGGALWVGFHFGRMSGLATEHKDIQKILDAQKHDH